jgi:tetratricopeptide (TPR) repeat protein
MQYMAKAGYDPRAAVTLQETFVRLAKNNDPNWLSGLFASHPPSMERVMANKETLKQLPAGGEIGTKRFQTKTAHLRKTKKAYEYYDEGRKALQEKNYRLAESLAAKALLIEPREALFSGLQADSHFAKKNYRKALTFYDTAIRYNNRFFQFYVQRGLTKRKTGNSSGAEKDLKYSLELLPTATAYNALGEISLAKGLRQEAKKYFKAAAPSNSSSGKQAAVSFIKLDFPDNPQAYIKVAYTSDRNNKLRVKITNASPFHVRDIKIAVLFLDEQQKSHRTQLSVNDTIQAGKALLLPAQTTSTLTKYQKSLQMQVTSASVVPK